MWFWNCLIHSGHDLLYQLHYKSCKQNKLLALILLTKAFNLVKLQHNTDCPPKLLGTLTSFYKKMTASMVQHLTSQQVLT